MKIVMCGFCKDPNDINKAIINKDPNWEDLESAEQIISIAWDTHQGCYSVFWWVERE